MDYRGTSSLLIHVVMKGGGATWLPPQLAARVTRYWFPRRFTAVAS